MGRSGWTRKLIGSTAAAAIAGGALLGLGGDLAGAADAPFNVTVAIRHLPKVAPWVTDHFSESGLYRRAILLSAVGRTTERAETTITTDEHRIDTDAITASLAERSARRAAAKSSSAAGVAEAAGRQYDQLKATLQQTAIRMYISGGSVLSADPEKAGRSDADVLFAQDYMETAVGPEAAIAARAAALRTKEAETAASAAAAAEARAEADRSTVLMADERSMTTQLRTQLVTVRHDNTGAVAADHRALVAQEARELTSASALQFKPSKPLPALLSTTNVALTWAFGELGKPYLWGGTGPNSFDCSGLMQYVWNKAGVSIPRVAADQDAWTDPVPLSQLLPGDLVFYGTSYIHHVGMYIGDGLMINAPHTGTVVQVSPIWWSDLAGFGRVHADGTPTATHDLPTASDPAPKVVNSTKPVPSETKPPPKAPKTKGKKPPVKKHHKKHHKPGGSGSTTTTTSTTVPPVTTTTEPSTTTTTSGSTTTTSTTVPPTTGTTAPDG